MDKFRGKKLLLVNIATGSPRIDQLARLEKLSRQFRDSLVIIAFPSNSFGNEPKSNAEIQKFCRKKFDVSFIIAAKGDVNGSGAQRMYRWLSHASENGVIDGEIKADFQMYLINNNGELIGFFEGSKDADDPLIIQAIKEN